MSAEYIKDLPISQSVLDDIPIPFHVYQPDGFIIAANHQADIFWGIPRRQLVGKFNAFANPQLVVPEFSEYFEAVLHGEVVVAPPKLIDTSQLEIERAFDVRRHVGATYFPFRNPTGTVSYVVMMNSDIPELLEPVQEAGDTQHAGTVQDKLALPVVSPVVQIWDSILTVPLVGDLDTSQTMAITKNVVEAIVRYQAKVVIVDITDLSSVDTVVVSHLMSIARACRLLGSDVVLTGISSSVAHAIGNLGLDLAGVVTKANLRAGIAWAFDRRGLRVVRKASTPCSDDSS